LDAENLLLTGRRSLDRVEVGSTPGRRRDGELETELAVGELVACPPVSSTRHYYSINRRTR
jgi:hypothetical protein